MKSVRRLAIVLIILFTQKSQAGDDNRPTVAQMCVEASLIAEGETLRNGQIAIRKVWKSSHGFDKEPQTLDVDLRQMSRIPYVSGKPSGKEITAKNVTVFLAFDDHSQMWFPLGSTGFGSPGVFWWDNTNCYRYERTGYPKLHFLVSCAEPVKGARSDNPVDLRSLRKAIEEGLKLDKKFQEDQAIKDPVLRAETLVSYLLPRTSPDPGGGHLKPAASAIYSIGQAATAAILSALESARPDEEIESLLYLVRDLKIEAAKPKLIKILERKDRYAFVTIQALQAIGDPATAKYIRPFLREKDSRLPFAASRALTILGDKDSYDAIAAIIPPLLAKNSIYNTADLLNDLYRLDRVKGRDLTFKTAKLPAMEPVRNSLNALRSR